MAASLLATMNLHQLVASTEDDYVSIAVRLATEERWRSEISRMIATRSNMIWQREEVVLEWSLFFLTALRYVLMP